MPPFSILTDVLAPFVSRHIVEVDQGSDTGVEQGFSSLALDFIIFTCFVYDVCLCV